MQPKSDHPAAAAPAASAAIGESASFAGSSTATALPQEAPVIGIRTLLEFVAWLVSTNSPDGTTAVSKGKTGSQMQASKKSIMFLMEELGAVGVAVRRMQVMSLQGQRCKMSIPNHTTNDNSNLHKVLEPESDHSNMVKPVSLSGTQLCADMQSMYPACDSQNCTCGRQCYLENATSHSHNFDFFSWCWTLCAGVWQGSMFACACAGGHDRSHEDS